MKKPSFKDLKEAQAIEAGSIIIEDNFKSREEYSGIDLKYTHIDIAILLEEGIYVCFQDTTKDVHVKVGLLDKDSLTDYPFFKALIYIEGKRKYLHISNYERALKYLSSLNYFKKEES